MGDGVAGPIEIRELLERVENDIDLLGDLVAIFGETQGEMTDAVHAAARARDAQALARSAHALKGSVANFCAADVVAAALALEKMGRAGALEGVDAAVAHLDREMARFGEAMTTVVEDARRVLGL